VKCFMSPPTQYRLYGRWFLQVKRPNQQYQSTEGESTKEKGDVNQLSVLLDIAKRSDSTGSRIWWLKVLNAVLKWSNTSSKT